MEREQYGGGKRSTSLYFLLHWPCITKKQLRQKEKKRGWGAVLGVGKRYKEGGKRGGQRWGRGKLGGAVRGRSHMRVLHCSISSVSKSLHLPLFFRLHRTAESAGAYVKQFPLFYIWMFTASTTKDTCMTVVLVCVCMCGKDSKGCLSALLLAV